MTRFWPSFLAGMYTILLLVQAQRGAWGFFAVDAVVLVLCVCSMLRDWVSA